MPGCIRLSLRFHEALGIHLSSASLRVRSSAMRSTAPSGIRPTLAMRRFAPNGGRFFIYGWGDIARAGRFGGSARMCLNSAIFLRWWSARDYPYCDTQDYKSSAIALVTMANGYHGSLPTLCPVVTSERQRRVPFPLYWDAVEYRRDRLLISSTAASSQFYR